MQKRTPIVRLLCGIIFIFIFVSAFICFKPKQLISLPYTVSDSISSETDICVTFVSFNGQDLTDKINHTELVDLLSKYSFRISVAGPSLLPNLNNTWEINLNHGGKSLHIVVGESGEQSFYYSNTIFLYKIIEAETLWQKLCTTINVETVFSTLNPKGQAQKPAPSGQSVEKPDFQIARISLSSYRRRKSE